MQIDSTGLNSNYANNQPKMENAHNIEQESTNTKQLRSKTQDIEEKATSDPSEEKTKNQQLLEAIEKASGKVEIENKGLEFAIHEETNRIIIRIVNEDTHEVVKELPSEKILDMVAKMIELSGIYVNEKR